MNKKRVIKKFTHSTSLSDGQKKFVLLFLILSFAIQIVFITFYASIKYEKEANSAKLYAENIAAGVELSINQCLSSTQVIKNLYLEYGEYFINDFDLICDRLVKDNILIGSLYVAPDGIVKCAYPKKVEDSTIGFNMLQDPIQAEKAQLALDTRMITVAGPHSLIEGGTGFIIRNPIFQDDKFLAFSIVVIDWDIFTKKILERLSETERKYKFGIWKEHDEHAVTDGNGFILKNAEGNISKNVVISVNVPNDVWYISVEPYNGWKKFGIIKFEVFLSLLTVILINIFNVLRQREHARKIYMASHDDLTGLLQRNSFLKRVDRLFKDNPKGRFAVIASDVKNFKVINTMYGNEKADELLVYLANAYNNLAGEGICARYGGDQFMCIFPLPEVKASSDLLKQNAELIVKNAPVGVLNVKYGIYENVDTSLPASIVCDRALLAARSIHNEYDEIASNYEGPLSRLNMRKQELESLFLSSLENDNFKIWLQPKFNAFTEKIIGAEALVRWVRDDGTIVSPMDFITVFEEDGLIYRLDLHVFKTVCEKIKYWKERGKNLVPISVNISRVSLQHKDIIQEYKRIVEEAGIDKALVPLEITESASADAKETKKLVEEFKDAGFMIHMDDFGSGFSSLGNLNSMPFDEIKLDKSLIDYIGTPDGDELLKHALALVQFKGLKSIAEGVETKDQLEFLKALKCDHIQGYYFSAPMPYEKFIECLKKYNQ